MKYSVAQLAQLAGYSEKRVWDLLQAKLIPPECDSQTLAALHAHALRGRVIRFEPIPTQPALRGVE